MSIIGILNDIGIDESRKWYFCLNCKRWILLTPSTVKRADVFLQTWGSTALGFGGVGGQAMSNAYTTVFGDILKDAYVVFFGKKIAYVIENPTEQFFEDLNRREMVSVDKAKQRY